MGGIEADFIALVGVEGGTLLGSDRQVITDIATLFEFEDEGKSVNITVQLSENRERVRESFFQS